MNITPAVLAVLDECTTEGDRLRLPEGQLDRADYVAVDKVLRAAGGKWNRSARAHVFDRSAADALDALLTTGQVTTRQEMGYFPTPPNVVEMLLDLADVQPGMTVLEPSAGQGAIAVPLHERGCDVHCVEYDEYNAEILTKLPGVELWVRCADFLSITPGPPEFDRVVMNPPFARQQDIAHVTHALEFLVPGGLLVSVMAGSVVDRTNRAALEFRRTVSARGGRFSKLPENSFRESGTGVNTVIVAIPAEARAAVA